MLEDVNLLPGEDHWRELEQWVGTSFNLVAARRLARLVIEENAPDAHDE